MTVMHPATAPGRHGPGRASELDHGDAPDPRPRWRISEDDVVVVPGPRRELPPMDTGNFRNDRGARTARARGATTGIPGLLSPPAGPGCVVVEPAASRADVESSPVPQPAAAPSRPHARFTRNSRRTRAGRGREGAGDAGGRDARGATERIDRDGPGRCAAGFLSWGLAEVGIEQTPEPVGGRAVAPSRGFGAKR